MEGEGHLDALTSSWRWEQVAINEWPSSLPSSMDREWGGWSKVPDSSQKWDVRMRSLVHEVIADQYASADIAAPTTLNKLEQEQCLAVTVGHQLCIGGGPAFFHHKIFTAIRTAKQLTERWGRPVVPVFWMASEDHDWQEISTVAGSREEHVWMPMHSETPIPVGLRSLDGLREVFEQWCSEGVPIEAANGLREDLEHSMRVQDTLSGVMRRWLHRWFGREGLLVLDPMDVRLKRSASALWASEFKRDGIARVLQGRPEMSGPAFVRENNVFWLDANLGRLGVVPSEKSSSWKAGEVTISEPQEGWEEWAKVHAAQCSPGVLLRPVYQEFLLQSAAVILGPGEWGYWQQLTEVFRRHGQMFPSLKLRDHGVVHSPQTIDVGWNLSHGWMAEQDWDRWVIDQWMVDHVAELDGMERQIKNWAAELGHWASAKIPQARGAAGALEASVRKSWEQWLKKVRRSVKGADANKWANAKEAHGHLVRRNIPQDRWANWLVLAGSDERLRTWHQSWLDADVGLATQVWVFGPPEENIDPRN